MERFVRLMAGVALFSLVGCGAEFEGSYYVDWMESWTCTSSLSSEAPSSGNNEGSHTLRVVESGTSVQMIPDWVGTYVCNLSGTPDGNKVVSASASCPGYTDSNGRPWTVRVSGEFNVFDTTLVAKLTMRDETSDNLSPRRTCITDISYKGKRQPGT